MRVLHVISSGGMYGAESVILDLSRALQRSGHTSEIAVFANSAQPNSELRDRAGREGIAAHVIPCKGQLDVRVPACLRVLVSAERFDVVHSHGYKGDVYAFLALRRSAVPLVATCHNWIDGDLALRLYGRLDRFVLRRFAGVAAVSAGVAQRLVRARVPPQKVRTIRNVVELDTLTRIERGLVSASDSPLRVGIVARLSPETGVDVFLRMAAALAPACLTYISLLPGRDQERASLEKSSANWGSGVAAILLGRQEDMPAFYRHIDLLVISSRTEGLPMALLEGMASGLPVVATRVGEVPDVIQEGRTGYVVAVEDERELASAVSEVLKDPTRLRGMGEAAREDIKANFSADRMAKDYVALYDAVLQSRPSQIGRSGGAA